MAYTGYRSSPNSQGSYSGNGSGSFSGYRSSQGGGGGSFSGTTTNFSDTLKPEENPFLTNVKKQTSQPVQFGTQSMSQMMEDAVKRTQQNIVNPEKYGQFAYEQFQQKEAQPATQKFTDYIGKAGKAGTLGAMKATGEFETQLAKAGADVRRGAEFDAEKLGMEQALKIGELGQRATQGQGELALGGAELISGEGISYADLNQRERAAIEDARQFNTRLDFDQWATQAGLNDNERNRVWQTLENENEQKAALERVREQEAGLNARQTAELALEEERLWGRVNPDGTRTKGSMELEAEKLGIEATNSEMMRIELLGTDASGNPVLDATGQPVKGRLQIAAEQLAESIRLNDLTELNNKWEQAIAYAELLEPEEAGAWLATTAQGLGISVPVPVTSEEAVIYRSAATDMLGAGATEEQIIDKAKELAFANGMIYKGTDGVTTPKQGEDKSFPRQITPVDSPTSRIANTGQYETPEGWKPITDGEWVEFTAPMNMDAGFPLPAGKYKAMTLRELSSMLNFPHDTSYGVGWDSRFLVGEDGKAYLLNFESGMNGDQATGLLDMLQKVPNFKVRG